MEFSIDMDDFGTKVVVWFFRLFPLVFRAELLARIFHKEQWYDEPNNVRYYTHLNQTAEVVKGSKGTKTEIAAAFLHDILEDTDCPAKFLYAVMGQDVYFIVKAVTNITGLPREERKRKTYAYIRACGVSAVKVKLADRLCNGLYGLVSEDATGIPNVHLNTYIKEYRPLFRDILYRNDDPNEIRALWFVLDELFIEKKEEAVA